MKIVVLKFGGTSVGTIEKIKKVADIIVKYRKKKFKVIVVSSAMSGVTNDLIYKSKKISQNFSDAEYDTICKRLHDEWDDIEHYHKHLINKEDLVAGTGYSLKYPTIVKDSALLLKEKSR